MRPMEENHAEDMWVDEKRPTRITVTLPPDNYELLVRAAKMRKVSASWIVRDAVDKYFAAETPLFRQNVV